jgi:hypothetical protein
MTDGSAKDTLKQQVLDEINQSLGKKRKPQVYKPGSVFTTSTSKPDIDRVMERWNQRNVDNSNSSGMTSLADLNRQNHVIISGGIKSTDTKLLSTFDNVFNIVGDYMHGKPQGPGVNICAPNMSKYCNGLSGEIVIYPGPLLTRQKLLQRSWSFGDVRSFRMIDFKYVEKYFDPKTGRIPGEVSAAVLWLEQTLPGKQVALFNIQTADLPAWDQMILKEHTVVQCV